MAAVLPTSSAAASAQEHAATCGMVRADGSVLSAWTELAAPPPWQAGGSEHASRMSTA
ncbi:hypothetical protein RKD27_000120 [Streptomyces sp. SAI-126]|uniref:hypothetical protein n=1 Tax=Streptomyces sp. SAI-126 TaxID=3377732 RepID=UPI00135768C0